MRRSVITHEANLPGYDTLRSSAPKASRGGVYQTEAPTWEHYQYLERHPIYAEYMCMDKGLANEASARRLVAIGDALSEETLPTYLDAAGWAYAEAGLMLENDTAVRRTELVTIAEERWAQSIEAVQASAREGHYICNTTDEYRTALSLAYAPIIKSLIVGNVAESVRKRAFASTLAIAQSAAVQQNLAHVAHNITAVSDYEGLLHECNALLTLLYLNDPRYIPLPASARADSGYYHREQTHDVVLLNHHWGQIRKALPIEVKGKASASHRKRYKALIVRGIMHLMVDTALRPTDTLNAYAALYDQGGSIHDQRIVDYAAANMLHLLQLYQRGRSNAVPAMEASPTTFHDASYVARLYRSQ